MARTITLVLLGGGVMLGGAAMVAGQGSGREDRRRECEAARAQNRLDAEQICAAARTYGSSGSRHYGGSWFFGRSATPSRSTAGSALVASSGFRAGAATASARGGFGSSFRSSSGS